MMIQNIINISQLLRHNPTCEIVYRDRVNVTGNYRDTHDVMSNTSDYELHSNRQGLEVE